MISTKIRIGMKRNLANRYTRYKIKAMIAEKRKVLIISYIIRNSLLDCNTDDLLLVLLRNSLYLLNHHYYLQNQYRLY